MPLPYTRPDARRTRLFTSLALLSLALVISGCSKVPRRYTCHRAVGPIAIDGKLSEDAWTHASWTDRFVDIEGTHKPRPRLDTKVKMLWDDQFLYIGAWLAEPHVCAYLQDHDLIVYHDNDFEVFIDPNGDAQEYYEIEVNALNTIFDLLLVKTYIEGGPALHDWDLKGLESAVHVEGTLNNAKMSTRAGPWNSRCRGRPRRVRPTNPHRHMMVMSGASTSHAFSGHTRSGYALREDAQRDREQLGLVAPRHDQHAPASTLGLCRIQDQTELTMAKRCGLAEPDPAAVFSW